jgi:hypothetical protein
MPPEVIIFSPLSSLLKLCTKGKIQNPGFSGRCTSLPLPDEKPGVFFSTVIQNRGE